MTRSVERMDPATHESPALVTRRQAGVFGCCWALLVALAHTPALAALDREQAVQAARAGRLDEAIAALAALEAAGDPLARQDLVVVYGWAGRRREAIAAYERIAAPGAAPDYVRRAAASAYRGERRFVEAEALARALLRANPTTPRRRGCSPACWSTAAAPPRRWR